MSTALTICYSATGATDRQLREHANRAAGNVRVLAVALDDDPDTPLKDRPGWRQVERRLTEHPAAGLLLSSTSDIPGPDLHAALTAVLGARPAHVSVIGHAPLDPPLRLDIGEARAVAALVRAAAPSSRDEAQRTARRLMTHFQALLDAAEHGLAPDALAEYRYLTTQLVPLPDRHAWAWTYMVAGQVEQLADLLEPSTRQVYVPDEVKDLCMARGAVRAAVVAGSSWEARQFLGTQSVASAVGCALPACHRPGEHWGRATWGEGPAALWASWHDDAAHAEVPVRRLMLYRDCLLSDQHGRQCALFAGHPPNQHTFPTPGHAA